MINPSKAPQAIPPTVLNCLIIGNLATTFNTTLTISKTILVINKIKTKL